MTLEQTFRDEWGKVLAALIGFLGDFELAEEAAQEAFAIAAERWPRDGTPDNPAAWLVTTARNRAINRIRRNRTLAEKTRLPELPETPTIEETVPGVVNVGWNGLLAPAGTPAKIIDKLNAVAVAALKTPDVMAKMKLQGLHVMSSTPAEFAALIAREVDDWAKIIPSIGIRSD